MIYLLCLSLILGIQEVFSATYGYVSSNGPDTWATSFADACAGTSNSPIDIPYNGVNKVRDWLPFQLIHYEVEPYKMYIENNGHTAVVTFDPKSCTEIPTVIQGNLPGTYELAQFHLHWGDENGGKGSEHTLFGKQYDAELHFVHYNTKCGNNLGQAIANCAGHEALAVLGVFIDVGGDDNHAYDEIIDGLKDIQTEGTSAEIKTFDMTKLMPHDLDEFFRYNGGLTTPSCNEIVTWTVFKNHVKISWHQYKKFFDLQTTNGGATSAQALVNNFRPVVALNDRHIYYADLKLRCDHRDWTKSHSCLVYYKESSEELGFMEAVHSCIGYHYAETPYQGLIPVGRLRCLRNRYNDNSADDICGRFFRVNAIKDNQGIWREYPSGNRVSFHHFPEFKPRHGGYGDTLVWDAFLNRLFIQDEHDHYNALCYRDYQNECEECDGFENGHICSNAGDCQENVCVCDDDFTGYSCQLGPVPEKEVVIVGGSTSSADSTQFYSGATNQASPTDVDCTIASYTAATGTTTDMVCDFVFGKGICCNGLKSTDATDLCLYYDCFTNSWSSIMDMPARLTYHASNVIRHKGRDEYWLLAGGQVDSITGTRSKSMYWLDDHLQWELISDEMEHERINHCQVQINDCEIAFIGGQVDAETTATDTIEIWNWKEHTWRTGPTLASAVDFPACGVLMDRTDYHKDVVIGCGRDSTGTYLQVWNLATNLVHATTYACPDSDSDATTSDDGNFKELDESYLVFTNSRGMVYTFNMENGFSAAYTHADSRDHYGGDAFVAPRGTSMCTN